MLTILSLLLAAASPLPADVNGTWDLKAGDTTMFRLRIVTTRATTTAVWERPEHFNTDGESFSHVTGPMIRRKARSVRAIDNDIEVAFDDPAPDSTPDIFRLHRIDAGHIVATYEHTNFEPFILAHSQNAAVQLGPWEVSRNYVRLLDRPTNAEMSAIFDADQAARTSGNIDWSVVRPADEKRRARTQELLDTGALQSGEDYYNAAFVFQHGSASDDFLKAHLLAMIAVARGKPDAIWIASATLDRYLHHIGKPQVLGTQFTIPKDAPITQEPYDRTLISDAMRKALHVPPIAEQETRRINDQARRSGGTAP